MQQLLLVEDDTKLSTYLTEHLSSVCTVTTVQTIKQACQCVEKYKYDVAIIDRVLPDGDGLEIIEYLTDISHSTKILALSKQGTINERVLGLEHGADDYLPKPFSITELTLRVLNLLKYEKKREVETLSVAGIQFTPSTGEIKCDNSLIRVRKKEAQILHCLMRYQNQVLSRNKIVEEAWSLDEAVPNQATLDVYIRRLRILLGNYGKHIITKRGFGYCFVANQV